MRNWKKETLAKNILLTSMLLESTLVEDYDITWLNKNFIDIIRISERKLEDQKRNINKWTKLHEEYNRNKKDFVLKYFKRNKKSLIKLGQKYPITYGKLLYLLNKLENQ